MRFLKDANFDLDERALQAMAQEIEDFLRVGSFTLAEWDSLSTQEKQIAVEVKRRLKLEEALLNRGALQVSSPEEAAAFLQGAGDVKAAAKLLLKDAVRDMVRGAANGDFLG